jgi:phosphoribosyl 1,2-cyclic phosphodiesterase
VLVSILASGSSGNAMLVSAGGTHVLIDAGISARRVAAGITNAGLDPNELSAVLVTHEHSDHVSGLGPVARRFGVPVYATDGTHGAAARRAGDVPSRMFIEAGRTFRVGELEIHPFATSHDCAEPVGYSMSDGARRVTIATDLGVVGRAVRRHISAADLVVLEFNHDERMLAQGPYPWSLKKRIMSNVGHLSNVAAAAEIAALRGTPLADLVLAHLSDENNAPELALAAAGKALEGAGRRDVAIHVSTQHSPLGPIEVRQGARGPEPTEREGVAASCTG